MCRWAAQGVLPSPPLLCRLNIPPTKHARARLCFELGDGVLGRRRTNTSLFFFFEGGGLGCAAARAHTRNQIQQSARRLNAALPQQNQKEA